MNWGFFPHRAAAALWAICSLVRGGWSAGLYFRVGGIGFWVRE